MSNPTPSTNDTLKKSFGLYDVVCIIVGIIIGSAIYQTPSNIAGMLGSAGMILLVWLLGGVLSFIGALCYAELASTHPKEGGDYFFLHHAFGDWAGFLYAWGRMWVIHTGNIASMAFIAGNYATKLYAFPNSTTVYALSAVAILTAINSLGVREGKWTQNLLTTTKVLGLGGVILAALFVPSLEAAPAAQPVVFQMGSFLLALIFVQFSFGGWSDCAFVAAEIKNPEKNVFRSLMTGIVLVTLIYCLINAALLLSLGVDGMAKSQGVMADLMDRAVGPIGGRLISALVVISALGSVNGMILVGARIYHAFGSDHKMFGFLGRWNKRTGTPLAAFAIQGIISVILVLTGSFESLIIYTAAAHWLFLMGTGLALIVFRRWEPNIPRPYSVPLYPLVPIAYIASCGLLFQSSLTYANSITPYGGLIGFGIVLVGLPVYWFSKRIE